MVNELDRKKTEAQLALEEKDDMYQVLEDMVEGDPRGIDWNKLMLEMPRTVWFQAQNIVKAYIHGQREMLHRQFEKEAKKPRRMSYGERQEHYIRFDG